MERMDHMKQLYQMWEQNLPKVSKEHAAYVPVIPALPSSQFLAQHTHQDTQETIEQRKWYSYCFQMDRSNKEFLMLINFLQARTSYAYQEYTYFFDDRETNDESCQGDHYHVLTSGNFKNKAGTLIKTSQTYIYEWLQRLIQQEKSPKASRTAVKSIVGYLDYLKNYSRSLAAYSPEFIQLAKSGYFHASPADHKEAVLDYTRSMQKQTQKQKELEEPPMRQIKLMPADKTFCQIRNYLERSKAIMKSN